MDLPTCPACGQSVLEDNAEVCPFCGSSMSGKPAKKPAAPPAAAAPSKAAPPAAKLTPSKAPAGAPSKPGAAKPGPTKPTRPAGDDALGVAFSDFDQAIRASTKQTPKQPLEVVCPMCDTHGFVPASAAGRDVRCANPDCVFPVFTAPAVEAKKQKRVITQAEKPVEVNRFKVYGVTALILLLFGGVAGGLWWMIVTRPTTTNTLNVDAGGPPANPFGEPAADPNVKKSETRPDDVVQPAVPASNPIVASALQLIATTAGVNENNRSVPYGRQLAAEAFATAGDEPGMRKQLDELARVGASVPYYRIPPLVEMAWQKLSKNDRDGAVALVAEASEAAPSLPGIGRQRLEIASSLAAAQVAVGKVDDAVSLISKHRDESAEGQLAAQLVRVRADKSFDLDRVLSDPARFDLLAPQWAAVAMILAEKGQWKESQDWCQRHPDELRRIDCLAVWAAAFAQKSAAGNAPAGFSIAQIAEPLSPAGKARLHARAAAVYYRAMLTTEGDQALSAAQAAIAQVQIPAAIEITTAKQVYHFQSPNIVPLKSAALAWAELAAAQSIAGRTEDSWKSMQSALAFSRAMAPSPTAIQQRTAEFTAAGTTAFTSQLKRELNLRSDDEAFRAVREYNRKTKEIEDAANARLNLQVALLEKASQWNIRDAVWNEVESRSTAADPNQNEPYFKTSVPWMIAASYLDAGQESRTQEIDAKLTQQRISPDPKVILTRSTEGLAAEGDVRQAARDISRSPVDKGWRAQWFMQLASRLVNAGKIDAAYEFVRTAEDPLWSEESLQLVGARGARSGQADAIWQIASERAVAPIDRLAFCRGLVAGLKATEK